MFRNLPIFNGSNKVYENVDLNGKIEIKAENEIINVQKEILIYNLKIT